MNGESGLDVLRDFSEVLFIVAGEKNNFDSSPVRRQQFLLHSANGKDFPSQCDLTRHGYIAPDGDTGQRGNQSGRDRDRKSVV
jgi:hypothetical protein